MEVAIALVLNLKVTTYAELKSRRRELRKYQPFQIYALCEYVWMATPYILKDFWRPWYEVYSEYSLDKWLEERLAWERSIQKIFKSLTRLTREEKAIVSKIVVERFITSPNSSVDVYLASDFSSASYSLASQKLSTWTLAEHQSPPVNPNQLLSAVPFYNLPPPDSEPKTPTKCSPNSMAFKHTPLHTRLHQPKQ